MNAPTLIVGLGGTGSKIVAKVASKTNAQQKKHVRFVCIDTDVNDLRTLREKNPFLVVIQTSAPYTVGEYLDKNHYARDVWFPTHHIMNSKTPTEGAGQVRAISRLAFDTCVREGALEPLEKAIEELYPLDGRTDGQALRVIVVSSLAGGTGSGIILPAAMYIKNYLDKHFKRNASVMRGFLLLPDIFFAAKSPEEINNLCCNGYAALRELDAFMRRSDCEKESGILRSLSLAMPDPTTGSRVDYKLAPFNFCFLYGAQNTSDQRLPSFEEYMDQAANIVYAQSISALSGRSNSSEDNTILTLCAGHGRNRFCGAGSSCMIYPKEDIIRYMADVWALKSMGEGWLYLDKKYEEYSRRQEQLMERDPMAEMMSLRDFYINTVETDKESALTARIRKECRAQDPSNPTQDVGKWEHYLVDLGEMIRQEIEADVQMENAKQELQTSYNTLTSVGKNETEGIEAERDAAYAKLMEYHKHSLLSAQIVASSIINNHILAEGDLTETSKRTHIEYWLRGHKDQFAHPASVRYFLYGLQNLLDRRIADSRTRLEKIRKDLKELDDQIDDEETENIREDITDYQVTKKVFIFPERVNLIAVDELVDYFQNHQKSVDEERDQLVRMRVLEALREHVGRMVNCMELFFSTLRICLEDTRRDRALIHSRYTRCEGSTTYYVCANSRCLDAMEQEMPYEFSSMDSEISRTIYREIKKMGLSRDEIDSRGLKKMYENEIMDYWHRAVLRKNGAKLEINVIDALMNEACYMADHKDITLAEQEAYCQDKLLQTANMAEPFIERPQGEIRHPIKVSCYSQNVRRRYEGFITRVLNDEGGYADASVDDCELIFYHALYGICAVDLQQFSPEIDSRTMKRRAGIYYEAYKSRVSKLGPVLARNSDITPHIDRNWHLAKYMPDLSDQVHQKEIKDVFRAMVWGLISENIKYQVSDHLYTPESNDNRDFIVPSKEGDAAKANPCDKLSELGDALAVNPPQVARILHSLDTQIEIELRDRKKFGETLLARRICWHDPEKIHQNHGENVVNYFRIQEFDKETDASIFDILYWYKYSKPVDEYNIDNVNLLRDAIIELVEYYISRFISPSLQNTAFAMVMVDQLIRFKENMTKQGRMSNGEPLRPDRLLDETVGIVTSALNRRFREEYLIDSSELHNVLVEIDRAADTIRDAQAKNPFGG